MVCTRHGKQQIKFITHLKFDTVKAEAGSKSMTRPTAESKLSHNLALRSREA